jgi:putative Ca2+/H+ antiporter (TMEM165/GDT1 family)
MRYRPLQVFCGFLAAVSIKMLVAVLVGQAIAELPRSVVTIASTLTFFLTALVIWFKKSDDAPKEQPHSSRKAMLIAFVAILFSEWGDMGQIMAATLTARFGAPFLVWIGATLALATKGLLGLAIGYGLRQRVPLHVLRYASVSLCLIMGVISAIDPILK